MSLIKQKGKSENGCFKKKMHVKFSEKTNISTPLIRTRTCAYRGVRNVSFFGKFDVFFFLKHLFWDSPFCLITKKYSSKLDLISRTILNESHMQRKHYTQKTLFLSICNKDPVHRPIQNSVRHLRWNYLWNC